MRRAEATAHARGRAIFYTPRYFICRAAPPRAQCGLTTAGVYAVRMLYGALGRRVCVVWVRWSGLWCVCCDVSLCPSCVEFSVSVAVQCVCVCYSIHKGRRSEAKREREVFEEASVACSSLARGRPVSSALSTLRLAAAFCKITQRPLF